MVFKLKLLISRLIKLWGIIWLRGAVVGWYIVFSWNGKLVCGGSGGVVGLGLGG